MNTANLFFALSQAICISIVQGIFTLGIVRTILKTLPELSSLWKYRLLLGGLGFLIIGFIFCWFKLYAPQMEILSVKPELLLYEKFSLLESIKHFLQQNSLLIFSIYSIGVAAHTFLIFGGFHNINKLKHDASLKVLPEWEIKIQSLSDKLQLLNSVRLFFSNKLIVPFTVGFLKPIIFFPIGMLNHLSAEQVEAILLHELAHIKRNDYLINIIQKLIETVLFFNPVVWLLAKELKNEREYCCDDLVLAYTLNPGVYAKALLLIEENRTNYNQLAMAADGAGKHSLFNRIKRLNVMKTVNSNPKHRLLAIVALVTVSLSIAWAVPSDSLKLKKTRDKTGLKYQVPPPPPAPPAVISDTTRLAPPPPPQAPSKIRFTSPMPKVAPPPPKAPSIIRFKSPLPKVAPPPPPEPPKKSGQSIQDTTNKVSKYFNSQNWNEQQEKIANVGKYFNGPEWKAQKEKIEKVNRYFNSKDWKTQLAKIKKNEKYFNSADWKAKIEKIENQGKYFDSPEWKAKVQEMENKGKYFESPEWIAKVQEMENKGKYFESPEWKAQVEKMEKMGVEIEKKFNSPEFKRQMKEVAE